MHERSDIGSYIKATGSIFPQTISGSSAVNGSAVDRSGYESCMVAASVGAATGSPTSYSVATKLQDSANGTNGWTDIASGATISADNTGSALRVDLSSARQYIRAVSTPTFSGGSSPAVPHHATIILGGAKVLPAA